LSKPPRIRILTGLLFALGVAVWFFTQSQKTDKHPQAAVPAAEHDAHAAHLERTGKLAEFAKEWRATLSLVRSHPEPELVRARLLELRLKWLEEDPLVLAQIVAFLLRAGDDAATGLPFEVGPGGVLGSWPTLRTFLLELLACADPDQAALTAREVLHATRSVDEYALALKPLTRPGPWRAPDAELADRFAGMLGNRDWQNADGFAEALDLVRVCHSPAVVAALEDWLNSGGDARLAGMALHEAAAEDPARVVLPVAADPDLLADTPVLRAELMARAAISDPAQEAAVLSYLENGSISQDEKNRFLGLFPLRSATTGYRLYGGNPAPFQQATVAADDDATLKIVQSWLLDPDLQTLQPSLEAMETRVRTWVNQEWLLRDRK